MFKIFETKKQKCNEKKFVKTSQNFIKQTKQILDIKNEIRQLEKTIFETPDNLETLDKLCEADNKLAKFFADPNQIKYRLRRDNKLALMGKGLGYVR